MLASLQARLGKAAGFARASARGPIAAARFGFERRGALPGPSPSPARTTPCWAGTRKALLLGPVCRARRARARAPRLRPTSSRLLEELPEMDLGVAEMAHGASVRGRCAGAARQRGTAVARFATANAALQAALQLHLAARAIVRRLIAGAVGGAAA